MVFDLDMISCCVCLKVDVESSALFPTARLRGRGDQPARYCGQLFLRVSYPDLTRRCLFDVSGEGKNLSRIKWRMPRHHFFACTDGRVDFAQLGTFGGDLGEFAMALAVLEHVRMNGSPSQQLHAYLTKEDVIFLLQSYLEETSQTHDQRLFTNCMDAEALQYLAHRANVKDPFHPQSRTEVCLLTPNQTMVLA